MHTLANAYQRSMKFRRTCLVKQNSNGNSVPQVPLLKELELYRDRSKETVFDRIYKCLLTKFRIEQSFDFTCFHYFLDNSSLWSQNFLSLSIIKAHKLHV